MCISSNQSFNTHRQCMLLKVWNVSVWKTYAFVENAIRDQTVFEATSQKNSERIWICEHINQYFHQLWNITMEQFITLCGRKELYVGFFIPISGKICWSQTLHVLTLLKLTSRKEVIKYKLAYLRVHLDNKCSIRTTTTVIQRLLSVLCIKQRWGCALQFVITFPSW